MSSTQLSSEEIAEDYKSSLEDLHFNSRYEIGNLTVIAKENIHAAQAIARSIEDHINKVSLLNFLKLRRSGLYHASSPSTPSGLLPRYMRRVLLYLLAFTQLRMSSLKALVAIMFPVHDLFRKSIQCTARLLTPSPS